MPRTKKTARRSPAPVQPSLEEEEAQECVSDSEEGSWQDSGDEDMKNEYTAEDAEARAACDKAKHDANTADDTLSDEADTGPEEAKHVDDTLSDEDTLSDPEKPPPAKRVRT